MRDLNKTQEEKIMSVLKRKIVRRVMVARVDYSNFSDEYHVEQTLMLHDRDCDFTVKEIMEDLRKVLDRDKKAGATHYDISESGERMAIPLSEFQEYVEGFGVIDWEGSSEPERKHVYFLQLAEILQDAAGQFSAHGELFEGYKKDIRRRLRWIHADIS